MSSAIVAKLNKEDIIKDTVKDLAFEILGELSVSYVDSDDIKLGNAMPMEATQAAPTIKFTPFDKSQLSAEDKLALLMTDPDAPSRTEHKCTDLGGDIAISGKGVVRNNYIGPGPPKNSGYHRYVFFLCKQPKGADSSTFTKVENIISWGYGTPGAGAYDYIKENNLQLVGANYYMVENTTVDFNYDM
nr:AAC_HP1_G0037500.mRNA.1.CDS.1 [Saccharomyces cerevisiae]